LTDLEQVRFLVDAHALVLAGDVDGAEALLMRVGAPSGSRVKALLHRAVHGIRAEREGRIAEAEASFLQIAHDAVPLPGALLAAGRFLTRQGVFPAGKHCMARARLCGYGGPSTSARMIVGEAARIEKLKKSIDDAPDARARPWLLKQLLHSEYGSLDAVSIYGALVGSGGIERLERLPIRSLKEHARARGLGYRELSRARPVPLPMPKIVGRGERRVLEGRARALFTSVIEDVVVTARSTLMETDDALLYDFQDSELERIPVLFDFDASVFEATGSTATLLRFGPEATRVKEAISMVGSSSDAFGHWMSEYLIKLFALKDSGVPAETPVLVDTGMPSQHREALAYFAGETHPLIEVGPFSSVRVDRLWVASNFIHIPLFPVAGTSIGPTELCPDADWILPVLASVEKPDRPADAAYQRLFVMRRRHLRRRLVNLEEIQRLCLSRGYVPIHLDDHSFEEQLWLVHNATHVVGLSGSSLVLSLLYGAPGMKQLILHPDRLDATPPWTAIGELRGQDVRVVLGDIDRLDAAYPTKSDYRIDPNLVDAVLTSWDG
jgi:hypothetical protein